MRRDSLLILALVPLLAACGGASGGGKVASASAKPAPPPIRAPLRAPPPRAQVQMVPGLEGVIGVGASELSRQFGTARLDVWEGDARKLQFTGVPCVLDVYLYPPAQGRDPIATYVEARRTDGREVDKVACVSALRKR